AVLVFERTPMRGTVGASGAICGLLTSVGVWAWMHRRYLSPEFVQAHFRAVGINLMLLVLVGVSVANVSNTAHVGGAVAGVLLSVPLAWLAPTATPRRRLVGAVALAAFAIAVAAVLILEVVPRYARGG